MTHCLESDQSRHIALDVERCMRTLYKIDSYQENYFVIQDFEQLFADTAPDFAPLYLRLKTLPDLLANAHQVGDIRLD